MLDFGLQIFESPAAVKQVRKRVYPRRKAKSNSHHARMDKKWLKRYGFKFIPQCYRMGDRFIVHPSLMPELRRMMKAESRSLSSLAGQPPGGK